MASQELGNTGFFLGFWKRAVALSLMNRSHIWGLLDQLRRPGPDDGIGCVPANITIIGAHGGIAGSLISGHGDGPFGGQFRVRGLLSLSRLSDAAIPVSPAKD